MPIPHSPKDRAVPARARAFYELTKPGIAVFAMMSAGVAYWVGAGGTPSAGPLLHTLFGTLLATAGALALNQYMERGLDAMMSRTRGRPLPSGRLRPRDALVFALLLVAAGVAHLWATVGTLPALLTLASAGAYNFVYTPLKSRSSMATLAGSVPGGMPALIGWSAATGELSRVAYALFGIGFLWQIPHVLALAWLLREDYARVGFRLAPPADPSGRTIGRHMVVYALALLPVSALPTLFGATGPWYLSGALLLGATFLAATIRAHRAMTTDHARTVFLGTLAYLPLLYLVMVLDTIRS